MVNQVNGSLNRTRGLYANQPDRAAWREEMLGEFLQKSRELSEASYTPKMTASARTPAKGSLVDVFV
jgi:hypothetical protein